MPKPFGLDELHITMDRKAHWEQVYQQKDSESVSWFQPRPELSMQLIAGAGLAQDASIIDVGAGASTLVDHLLDEGFANITLLDIAASALDVTRERLARRADSPASSVRYLAADITQANFPEPFALWHDRAVFHFLTQAQERSAYLERLHQGLQAGGTLIVATFAQDGPERCSDLLVQRYSLEELDAVLGERFVRIGQQTEQHQTPAGKQQSFVYGVYRKQS